MAVLALLLSPLPSLAQAGTGTVSNAVSPSGEQATRGIIDLQLVASGLQRPVYVTAAPADRSRLFVVEKVGRIRIVEDGLLLPVPFLDITHLVKSQGSEQGLFSVAFHPRYEANGLFYVSYTGYGGTIGDSVIARYQVSADPNLADPLSASTVLTASQPFSNHNGGQLQFDPLGYLHIALGDGGSWGDPRNNAQGLDTWLGKILRIDVDSTLPYAVPPSNPFAGPGLPLDEIWALGLRNPWRFSFDRLTGDMWIGDVGQDLWEEVDLEPAGSLGGLNWGWRCKEGTRDYNMNGQCPILEPTLKPPVYEYDHREGCSITGGYVYRGSPGSSLFGHYLFADYCVGNELRTLHAAGAGWARTDYQLMPPVGRALGNPSSFGQDAVGDLYVTDYADGEVFKLLLRPATCVPGNYDVNGDDRLDVVDVQLVAADWLRPDYVPDLDVDCSGGVDVVDIVAVAGVWGTAG